MAAAGRIFTLHTFPSRSRSTVLKSFAACHYTIKQRYSSQGSKREHHSYLDIEERAPSTAEEFKRMAEEKLKAAEQGVASQTVDKIYDGTEEATLGDSNVDSVKNRYKEHEPGADHKRRPHDD